MLTCVHHVNGPSASPSSNAEACCTSLLAQQILSTPHHLEVIELDIQNDALPVRNRLLHRFPETRRNAVSSDQASCTAAFHGPVPAT